MDEPLLVSLHIPKTAGSTLLRIFATRFGDRLQRAYQPPAPGRPRTETDGWPDIEHPLCIHGHAVLERFPWVRGCAEARFVTFLREPLAGAVSLWRYQSRLVPWNESKHEPLSLGLEEFVLSRYNHNRYTQWIQRTGRAAEQFFLVGLVERFDDSLSVLFRTCGWPPIPYGHENQSAGAVPPLDAAVVDEFRRRNEADYALYARASALLEEKIGRC